MKIKSPFLAIVIITLSIIIYSCTGTLTEKYLANEKVILSAPIDSLVTNDSIPSFYWEILDGATKYQLQVVSPKFDAIIKVYADTTIATNLLNFSLNKGKQYQWRVKAKNSSSETAFSQIRTITIQ